MVRWGPLRDHVERLVDRRALVSEDETGAGRYAQRRILPPQPGGWDRRSAQQRLAAVHNSLKSHKKSNRAPAWVLVRREQPKRSWVIAGWLHAEGALKAWAKIGTKETVVRPEHNRGSSSPPPSSSRSFRSWRSVGACGGGRTQPVPLAWPPSLKRVYVFFSLPPDRIPRALSGRPARTIETGAGRPRGPGGACLFETSTFFSFSLLSNSLLSYLPFYFSSSFFSSTNLSNHRCSDSAFPLVYFSSSGLGRWLLLLLERPPRRQVRAVGGTVAPGAVRRCPLFVLRSSTRACGRGVGSAGWAGRSIRAMARTEKLRVGPRTDRPKKNRRVLDLIMRAEYEPCRRLWPK